MFLTQNYLEKPPFGTELDHQSAFNQQIVCNLPVNEPGGLIINDASELRNGFTANGPGVSWINDTQLGKSLNFDGSSGYLFQNAPLIQSGAFTCAAWCCLLGTGTQIILVQATNSSGTRLEYLRLTGTTVKLGCFSGGVLITGNITLNLNQWYFLTSTCDAVGNVNLYINGVLDKSAAAGAPVYTGGTVLCRIGATASTVPSTFFQGCINNLIVWNRVLTANEVFALYENTWQLFIQPSVKKYFIISTGSIINLTSKVLSESSLSAQQSIGRALSARNLSNTSLLANKSIKQNINSQSITQSDNQSNENVKRPLNSQSITQAEDQVNESIKRNLTTNAMSQSYVQAEESIARKLASQQILQSYSSGDYTFSAIILLTSKCLSYSYNFAQQLINRKLNSQAISQTDSQAQEHVQRNLNSQIISQTEDQSSEHVQRKLASQAIASSGFVRSSFGLLLAFASKVISISFALGKIAFTSRKFQLLSFRRSSQQAINQGGEVEDSGQ